MQKLKIGVLCVTYNRLAMLKKLLNIYTEQEEYIDTIIVVDNNSTDQTNEFLKEWEKAESNSTHIFISLKENIGGSGGFYEGLKYYKEIGRDFDYIYLSDDDAFPESTLFNKFINIKYTYDKNIVAICTSVINGDKIDINHRSTYIKKGLEYIRKDIAESEYCKPFKLQCYSFVGIFLKYRIIKKGILPDKEFFIYYDDTNHSIQVSKEGEIICIPDLKVFHKVKDKKHRTITWRDYYILRNRLLTIKYNFGLFPYFIELYKTTFNLIKEIIKNIYFTRSIKYQPYKLKASAIFDSFINKKGKHYLYKPGWYYNS